MARTAFIVIRSPQELNPADAIRRFAGKEDAFVVLFEDAVYNAVRAENAKLLSDVAADVSVARDDLEARGFGESDLKVGRAADYDDIIDTIMDRTERTVTI